MHPVFPFDAHLLHALREVIWPSGLFLFLAIWGYGVVPGPKKKKTTIVKIERKGFSHNIVVPAERVHLLKEAVEKDGGKVS